jgi:hypothetical protein
MTVRTATNKLVGGREHWFFPMLKTLLALIVWIFMATVTFGIYPIAMPGSGLSTSRVALSLVVLIMVAGGLLINIVLIWLTSSRKRIEIEGEQLHIYRPISWGLAEEDQNMPLNQAEIEARWFIFPFRDLFGGRITIEQSGKKDQHPLWIMSSRGFNWTKSLGMREKRQAEVRPSSEQDSVDNQLIQADSAAWGVRMIQKINIAFGPNTPPNAIAFIVKLMANPHCANARILAEQEIDKRIANLFLNKQN